MMIKFLIGFVLLMIIGCSSRIPDIHEKSKFSILLTDDDKSANDAILKKKISKKIEKNSLFSLCCAKEQKVQKDVCITVDLALDDTVGHEAKRIIVKYYKIPWKNKGGFVKADYDAVTDLNDEQRSIAIYMYENESLQKKMPYYEYDEDNELDEDEFYISDIKENIIDYNEEKKKRQQESLLLVQEQSFDAISDSRHNMDKYIYSGYGDFTNDELIEINKDAINLHNNFVPYRFMKENDQ